MGNTALIRLAAVATAVQIALIAAPVASALKVPADASTADALAALEAAEAALAPEPQALSTTPLAAAEPPDATVALNQLAASYSQLGDADRRRARGLLARPTDGIADQYGDGYPAGAAVASVESPHFCVHWVNDSALEDAPDLSDTNGSADGDGIPDYVEAIVEIAEYSRSIEVAPGTLGWAPPKPDKSGCGADPGAHADIYLRQLGRDGIFGYESPDPGQGAARSQYGYIVVDDDFAFAEYGYADSLDPARVTLAHEYNHLLQQNYDSFEEPWMFESTATWAENHVYPTIDDYLFYVRSFASRPGTPITDPSAARQLRIYGVAVWNHWLDYGAGNYGVDLIRSAWELSEQAKPPDNAIAAYDLAIRKAGGRGFSRDFANFATATVGMALGLRRNRRFRPLRRRQAHGIVIEGRSRANPPRPHGLPSLRRQDGLCRADQALRRSRARRTFGHRPDRAIWPERPLRLGNGPGPLPRPRRSREGDAELAAQVRANHGGLGQRRRPRLEARSAWRMDLHPRSSRVRVRAQPLNWANRRRSALTRAQLASSDR